MRRRWYQLAAHLSCLNMVLRQRSEAVLFSKFARFPSLRNSYSLGSNYWGSGGISRAPGVPNCHMEYKWKLAYHLCGTRTFSRHRRNATRKRNPALAVRAKETNVSLRSLCVQMLWVSTRSRNSNAHCHSKQHLANWWCRLRQDNSSQGDCAQIKRWALSSHGASWLSSSER